MVYRMVSMVLSSLYYIVIVAIFYMNSYSIFYSVNKGASMESRNDLTAQEAAALLGINPSRMYALYREGRYGRKVGSYLLFTTEEVAQYQAERAKRPEGGRPSYHDRPKNDSAASV